MFIDIDINYYIYLNSIHISIKAERGRRQREGNLLPSSLHFCQTSNLESADCRFPTLTLNMCNFMTDFQL